MLDETIIKIMIPVVAGLFAREIWLHTQISRIKNDLKWIVATFKQKNKGD